MAISSFPHNSIGYPQRDQYSVKQVSYTLSSKITRGSPTNRLLDENKQKEVSLSFKWCQSSVQTFEEYWSITLRYGEIPCEMYLPVEDGYKNVYVYITEYTYSLLSSKSFEARVKVVIDNGSLGSP